MLGPELYFEVDGVLCLEQKNFSLKSMVHLQSMFILGVIF